MHFFSVQPRARRNEGALGNYRLYGDRQLVTPNEPNGLTFVYYLKQQTTEKVTVSVAAPGGATVRRLEGTTKAGINRVVWDLSDSNRQGGESRPGPVGEVRDVSPGEYDVALQVGDRRLTQKVRVLAAEER